MRRPKVGVAGIRDYAGLAALFAALACNAPAIAQKLPSAETSSAASSTPDFTGVFITITPAEFKAGGPTKRKGPPPRPIAASPLGDGSQGRSPNAPKLTPEYMAKWEAIRKSRMAASAEYDNNAKCLPPGMPAMMSAVYGNRLEVMQTKNKITFFTEVNDSLRRVYLDGRKPSERVLNDPTYPGYSTGHWENDTLVIDTVALRDNTFIDEEFTPHSEAMTVHERIRYLTSDVWEDKIAVTDPVALTEPWEVTKLYLRQKPGTDELRETVCPEGLADAK